MMRAAPKRQQGVALVTAILLVAIATLLAARIAWDNQLNMRRTSTAINMEQARHLALGVEAAAIQALYLARQQGIDYDDPGTWSLFILLAPAEIDGEEIGFLDGTVRDVHGKLNVNNLVNTDDGLVNADVRLQFESLISQLALDRSIVDSLIDWIDNNTVTEPYGAEDGSYTSLEPAYRPANNYIFDTSELRAVLGIDPESYELLSQYVTAIPPGWCGSTYGQRSLVNFNFAEPEVIGAILGEAADVSRSRIFPSGSDERLVWEQLSDINVDGTQTGARGDFATTESPCAEVSALITIGSTTLTMYSLLDRSGSNDAIVTRVRAFGLDK